MLDTQLEEVYFLDMPRIASGLSGVAGEYLVVGELSRRGYIASITHRNTEGVDILVSNVDATKMVAIQVKTCQERRNKWVLGKGSEKNKSSFLFYIFVKFCEDDPVQFFIVPSKKVAEFAKKFHKDHLNRGNKNSNMRKFFDDKGEYLNRWDLLGLG